ncbi:hypothetical protein EC973_009303 [Apophysomyces ossiformis]|uniref:ABC transporter domain-containing protein n=1 Tax=Apophysomyces ossiformis TaxID=679940 RepID=A0A8H7C0F5_9FUNG|nr:hypothetical protein EC973_009303 [Apophysomyces ossiformis]
MGNCVTYGSYTSVRTAGEKENRGSPMYIKRSTASEESSEIMNRDVKDFIADKESVHTITEKSSIAFTTVNPSSNMDQPDPKNQFNLAEHDVSPIHRRSVDFEQLEIGADATFALAEYMKELLQDQRLEGRDHQKLGLVWKNLTVEGLGAGAHTIPTVLSKITDLLPILGKAKAKKTILNNLNGFCKQGEMLLVLGRPGAGCTSLLKVLSDLRESFLSIDGDVCYVTCKLDKDVFPKDYRGRVVYHDEEDHHYPTLTTKETLQQALRTKVRGSAKEPKEAAQARTLELLVKTVGLTNQTDTTVGDAFLRGLSGGERKRLSIAELMTTQSAIACWDCPTRGLDSTSALAVIHSLRTMTDILEQTTIVTLYQASDAMFSLFDKVLLLDDGHCMYFGPAFQAKHYFESLGFYCPPRKSIPDFLTGIANPLEREIAPGLSGYVPQTPDEFEACYSHSDIGKEMMDQLEAYKNSMLQNKDWVQKSRRCLLPPSPYVVSFYQQVRSLTIRQFHLLIQDKYALIARYGSILIQGLIMGSCFYNIPLDATGAYGRAGAIFFTVLFNTLVSQAELIRFLMGRPVLEKHKHFALYRPSAFYIAQVVMDIPFALAQAALFSLCTYFLMGFDLTAAKFFTFLITIFFLVMTMNGFFRFFGAIAATFFVATQLSGVIVNVLLPYAGFAIHVSSMHPWLKWLYWINPLAYVYKTLLTNEMHGQRYSCEGPGNSVPFGPDYNDWRYKVCTMTGREEGESFVEGDNYLLQELSYSPWQIWIPDFIVVVAFFLLFALLTALTMEWRGASNMGSQTKLYLPGKAPQSTTHVESEEKTQIVAEVEKIATGTTFSWQHLNYTVPSKGGSVQLLRDVGGIIKPGHLTALMGASGAGKTTLLDVLARRKTIGKVTGRVYLNGEALANDFERTTGYCEQLDVHQPAVTVREALQFSAYLRQPSEVPREEKDAYVEKVIHLLEMEAIADAQIGLVESGFGISVEERKRLTIGVELVAKPRLLFLDEPTSGLDAQSSFNIIRFIRKLANAGWPVLCTIHQPSAILFEHFDHLLLLANGGQVAYHGEIGRDAHTVIEYFQSHGAPKCTPELNPAEYILSLTGTNPKDGHKDNGIDVTDWAAIWARSVEAKRLQDELEDIHLRSSAIIHQQPGKKVLTYAASFWTQFYLVHHRMALAYWRSPDYNVGRFLNIMVGSLLNGFTYWKMTDAYADIRNRLFALFATFLMANTLIILAQPKFMMERQYFRREHASRYYGWIPFALSVILVELPYILFMAAFFMFGSYWTAGLTNTSTAVGYFYCITIFFVFWAVTLGFVIASVAENPTVAAVLNPLIIMLLALFAGMFQSIKTMPKFWSSWFYWLNPFHYYIEGLAVNELGNMVVQCLDQELIRFAPPPNVTCATYLGEFFASGASGYVSNPNAVQPEQCGYCPYRTGSEMYSITYEWDYANRWRNVAIIACIGVFNVLIFMLLVFWKRKDRR